MMRRVVVQRWPAVPTAPNRMARMARSRSAVGVTMMALLPPSSRRLRPRRRLTTSPTWRPILVEPVAETSGMRGSLMRRSPTVAPSPMTRLKMAGSTSLARQMRSAILMVAMAVSGVWLEGFQMVASPQTAARALFQDQTATGKLKAVMMPTMPSGCHCSIMRCWGRSEAMVRP